MGEIFMKCSALIFRRPMKTTLDIVSKDNREHYYINLLIVP